jgi:arsenite methyltransferase
VEEEKMASVATVDRVELETKVKDMYRQVALDPHGDFHFEMGRSLAERLGYAPGDLDRIPSEAIESFAGVGYYFHLAELKEGQTVLDLGSGSGMDTFIAALKVGRRGQIVGIDMTDDQRAKAERLRDRDGFHNVTYLKGYIEYIPCEDASFDAVISNGVINLSADKQQVFREVARVLKRGGRLALSDIVTEVQLPDGIVCNSTLWAACSVASNIGRRLLWVCGNKWDLDFGVGNTRRIARAGRIESGIFLVGTFSRLRASLGKLTAIRGA